LCKKTIDTYINKLIQNINIDLRRSILMDENKSGLYIVAIVGVIAVVALVVLVLAGTGGSKVVSVAGPASINAEDAYGNSVRILPRLCTYDSDCRTGYYCDTRGYCSQLRVETSNGVVVVNPDS
jgi:hypothetical protein